MSEEQLRDVLARVVPEAPDSVADPVPVVRAARMRRRAQVAGAVGAIALVAVVGVVGGRALVEDKTSPRVVDEPTLAVDPYTAAPCPDEVPSPRAMPIQSEILAVRYCALPAAGLPSTPGPPDALVDRIDSFVDAVAALPEADPARCAAISMMPGNDRLLLELADGTSVTVAAQMCQDVDASGRPVDGADVTRAFLEALDAQRDEIGYEAPTPAAVGCADASTLAPARPGREHLVSAMVCGSQTGVEVAGAGLAALDDAWSDPLRDPDDEPCSRPQRRSYVVAATDRGDVVRLEAIRCGYLLFRPWQPAQPLNIIPVAVEDLTGS